MDDPEEFLGIVSDLERLIDEFVRRERNNEIVAEFYGRRDLRSDEVEGEDAADDAGGDASGCRADAPENEEASADGTGWYERHSAGGWVVATRPTPYVVLGSQYFDLYIMPPAEVDEVADPRHAHAPSGQPRRVAGSSSIVNCICTSPTAGFKVRKHELCCSKPARVRAGVFGRSGRGTEQHAHSWKRGLTFALLITVAAVGGAAA